MEVTISTWAEPGLEYEGGDTTALFPPVRVVVSALKLDHLQQSPDVSRIRCVTLDWWLDLAVPPFSPLPEAVLW
jgi:hypothetical protein